MDKRSFKQMAEDYPDKRDEFLDMDKVFIEAVAQVKESARIHAMAPKMYAAIRRILATARFIDAGTWHVSTDSIQLLEEAIKEK